MTLKKISALILGSLFSFFYAGAQNDLDAIRYSRTSLGGSPRFIAMGGAMGALGGDVSCTSYNPAGIGIFKKGEAVYSGGLAFVNNQAILNGKTTRTGDANFRFSNFGLAFSWNSEKDPSKRNLFCFSNNQLIDFNNQIQMADADASATMARDMLNLATKQNSIFGLNQAYEALGYNTYVLDYDSASGKFFSFVDMGRTLSQSRSMVTKGRMNELNFSLAQSHDDNFYLGLSLGIPRVRFESTTTHSEADSKDSMRVNGLGTGTVTSTYIDEPPFFYTGLGGFNSLRYTEYFKTDGYGINLKIGALFRLNSQVRVGAYVHSPTFYRLTDTYWYRMVATFDKNIQQEITSTFPSNEEEGRFEYRINSPMRFGLSSAFVLGKIAAIGIDYEGVNYQQAKLASDDPKIFEGVNAVIRNKYKYASNLRMGAELNTRPVMLRAGYALNGSPFGGFFSGRFDRHTLSFGVGIRTKSSYFYDITWYRTSSTENYFLFNTLSTQSKLNLVNSGLLISIGAKF